MSGLIPEKLYYALAKEPPKTMTELLAKVGKTMSAEEAISTKETNNSNTHANKISKKRDQKDRKVKNPKRYGFSNHCHSPYSRSDPRK